MLSARASLTLPLDALKRLIESAELSVASAKAAIDEMLLSTHDVAPPDANNASPSAAPQDGPSSEKRLIPLVDWPKFHPWPPIGGLRHLVVQSHTNGFDQVIRKIGNRILIDEAAFFQWVADRPMTRGVHQHPHAKGASAGVHRSGPR